MKKITLMMIAAMLSMAQMMNATTSSSERAEAAAPAAAGDDNERAYDVPRPFGNDDEESTKHWTAITSGFYIGLGVKHSYDAINNSFEVGLLNAIGVKYNSLHGQVVTLGVGINVPIHTVLLTQLTKFDGKRIRRLRAREFHQIAGRAGRAGFDTEGLVLALAPEHELENAKLMAKAGNDPKKQRKIHKKKPPEGFVNWSKSTFEKLIEAPPETLAPRMQITHSMVLAEVVQSGDARARLLQLIADSAQPEEEKAALRVRVDEVLQTLMDAGVVQREEYGEEEVDYITDIELQDNFSLDQPLSPFLLAALELLDPESETYALDVVSMAEAIRPRAANRKNCLIFIID